MKREVSSRITAEVSAQAEIVLSLAIVDGAPLVTEQLTVTLDGAPLEVREIVVGHGTRLHLLEAAPGALEVNYHAVVDGAVPEQPVTEADRICYLRPSRYAESDVLVPTAAAEFDGVQGAEPQGVELLNAVSSWVGTRLAYVSGSSLPTDGAVRTLLSRQGVCRDFAHLAVALLRACDVPARLVSVYAPGLEPMDFHAVAEALVDGAWHVVDATTLAPRSSMLRIATGRDASDTAFLTTISGGLTMGQLEVRATVDELPDDDITQLTRLR